MPSRRTDYAIALRHARRVLGRYGDRITAIHIDSWYYELFSICDDKFPGWDNGIA